MDSVYIVIPAYNEEKNIEQVVRSWYQVIRKGSPESRLVVADSQSTDRTHEILLDLKKEYDKLVILSETEKQHGPKVIALYEYAIENHADYIFQTDADGQTEPQEFAGFWMQRQQYDGLFGMRKVRGDGKSRKFVEQVLCLLLRINFGVKVPDANAPFRLMKTEVVSKYLNRLPSDYNIPNVMITTYFSYYQEAIKFQEITFKPRQGGKNSINVMKIIKIGMKALKEFRGFQREMKTESES